ncbi:hypothetical protein M422DRAFT_183027 [Sphaerobolus stellatus SS14]|uniref:Uncharacterized protein n=1 Tax=Sphaerobolus stellatus (strain SS14) TaxID=990650 RepID=A0A0C9UWF7_SPHS4|nr:hypothetical protein M422DRAFT_183027 [Sphaerobolus stellatus SS14]
MDHILTECDVSGQNIIWKMAENLWSHTGKPWTKPSLGLIVGCGLHMYTKENGRVDNGLSRLYTIIMSESAHLIWKTRNEWRIETQGNPAKLPQPGELKNKWLAKLNKRLHFDRLSSDANRYGKKATKRSIVYNTWKHLMSPNDIWDFSYILSGVLVGRVSGLRPARAPH